jgi:hypothetical protein
MLGVSPEPGILPPARPAARKRWEFSTGLCHGDGKIKLFHCAGTKNQYDFRAMNFALAFLTFVVFAFFLAWGIVLLMSGSPWLFLAALVVFFGSFAKFGCLSN